MWQTVASCRPRGKTKVIVTWWYNYIYIFFSLFFFSVVRNLFPMNKLFDFSLDQGPSLDLDARWQQTYQINRLFSVIHACSELCTCINKENLPEVYCHLALQSLHSCIIVKNLLIADKDQFFLRHLAKFLVQSRLSAKRPPNRICVTGPTCFTSLQPGPWGLPRCNRNLYSSRARVMTIKSDVHMAFLYQ